MQDGTYEHGGLLSGKEELSEGTWESRWEEHVRLTDNVKEEQSKAAESFPLSTQTDDSCWAGLQRSVPAKLHEEEPLLRLDHLREETDSECSDVDVDNDWFADGSSDTDSSMESLESLKRSKWLCPFFTALDEVAKTEHGKESTFFYCPACRGSGLGETDLYKGLKPLITHAKNYTKRRVKLHKQLAAILDDELEICNSAFKMEACDGKLFLRQWPLINDHVSIDPLIVWPPMVLIRATGVKLEMHQKRARIETKYFLEVFKDYCPKRVRHAYDPEDHLGLLSLLVFLDSPAGYMHAKHLVKNFKYSGKGRNQWNKHGALEMQSCCDNLMYAYMATEEDMVFFDTCDASKKKIAWSMKSYKEAIIQPVVEMREAKLENSLLKSQLQEQEEHNRFLEKALSKLFGNLELTQEEAYTIQKIASRP